MNFLVLWENRAIILLMTRESRLSRLRKIHDLLFFGGISKKNYMLIKEDVNNYNRKSLILYSALAMVALLFLYVFTIYLGSVIAKNRYIYLFGFIVLTVVFLLNVFVSHKCTLILDITKYFFVVAFFAIGIVISTNSYYDVSATYMVLLFVVPLLLLLRPVCLAFFIVLTNVIYLLIMHNLEEPVLFSKNLVNAILYGFASIVVSTSMVKMRIQKYETDYINRNMMRIDILTDLLNRHAYTELLNSYEHKELEKDLIYVSFDLNGLKTVNDTYGHMAGDDYIISAADCIKQAFANYGVVFRTGGDEFIAVIHTTEEICKKAIDSLTKEMNYLNGGDDSMLSISLGYSTVADLKKGTFVELAHIADERMYQDKSEYYRRTGKDRRTRS